jgi:hypothetical protein
MTIGPLWTDPVARQLYAEIASIEEQHVTQYESLIDPSETWLEQWLLHEANEVYNYWSCVQSESNPRIKSINPDRDPDREATRPTSGANRGSKASPCER